MSLNTSEPHAPVEVHTPMHIWAPLIERLCYKNNDIKYKRRGENPGEVKGVL